MLTGTKTDIHFGCPFLHIDRRIRSDANGIRVFCLAIYTL